MDYHHFAKTCQNKQTSCESRLNRHNKTSYTTNTALKLRVELKVHKIISIFIRQISIRVKSEYMNHFKESSGPNLVNEVAVKYEVSSDNEFQMATMAHAGLHVSAFF